MRPMIVWGVALAGLAAGSALERAGRFEDPSLREASGIVRSRRHADTFWVHNDSGNFPVLFAVRRDGRAIRSYRVAAPCLDWEDVAVDEKGHVYLGEIGNNDLRLRVRAIYRLDEPEPSKPGGGPLKLSSATYYRFADDDRFDAESLFIADGRAFVIAKRTDGRDADLYSIPLDPPAPVDRPAVAERRGSLPGCTEPATGADLSADGRLLAVVTTRAARVYQAGPSGTWGLVAAVPFEAEGVEGICWDGMDLVLASEDRSIYRIGESTWRASAGKGRR